MNYRDRIEVLRAAIAAKVPALLLGPPGGGKTESVRALAKDMGLPMLTLALAAYSDPADIAGVLHISDSGKLARSLPPATARFFEEAIAAAGGIFFWDELSCARPSVAAVAQRALSENMLGDHQIPGCIAQISAANPPDTATGGGDIPAAVANRLLHIPWSADLDEWLGWATPKSAELPSLALIAGYLHVRRDHLSMLPQDEEKRSAAWPSPRTWELCAKMLHRLGPNASYDTRFAAVIGTIGDGVGREFMKWADDQKLPTPEYILANPTTWTLPADGGRVHAALGGAIAMAARLAKENDEKTWLAGWKAIGHVAATASDIALSYATLLHKAMPKGATWKLPKEVDIASRMVKAMNASAGN